MKLKRDHVVGIILLIFGVVVCLYTSQIKAQFAVDGLDSGPRLFPYIVGVGLALCGLCIFLTTKRDKEEKPFLKKDGWIRIGILFALLVCFGVCMYLFGFLLSAPVFLFVLILILAGKNKVNKLLAAGIAVGVSLGLYYVFVHLLYVMLPKGRLF